MTGWLEGSLPCMESCGRVTGWGTTLSRPAALRRKGIRGSRPAPRRAWLGAHCPAGALRQVGGQHCRTLVGSCRTVAGKQDRVKDLQAALDDRGVWLSGCRQIQHPALGCESGAAAGRCWQAAKKPARKVAEGMLHLCRFRWPRDAGVGKRGARVVVGLGNCPSYVDLKHTPNSPCRCWPQLLGSSR